MVQETRVNTLTKNTGWIYVGKIGTQILALVTAILVIKKLDIDMYGTYNLLLKFIILYNVFSFSPVSSVYSRYIPELISHNNHKKFTKLVFTGLGLVALSTTILTFLLLIFRDSLSTILNIPNFES